MQDIVCCSHRLILTQQRIPGCSTTYDKAQRCPHALRSGSFNPHRSASACAGNYCPALPNTRTTPVQSAGSVTPTSHGSRGSPRHALPSPPPAAPRRKSRPPFLQPSATSGVDEAQDEGEADLEEDAPADEGAEVAAHLARGCTRIVSGCSIVRGCNMW